MDLRITDPTLQYLFAVSGGMGLFGFCFYFFCRITRGSIDGVKELAREIRERRWRVLPRLLLGTWLKEGHRRKERKMLP